jgi:hypothetical protein
VATLLLDIDKIMLNQYKIENIAYYSIATYIALVISVPSRAMQIVYHPITKLMHEDKQEELMICTKKRLLTPNSGRFCNVMHFVNINQLYEMIPKEWWYSSCF